MKNSLMKHLTRRSIRLPDYNYTQSGAYFITICTYKRKPLLGFVADGKMSLNQNGNIVQSCWSGIKAHFLYIELSAFVIMPNHLHGIIMIDRPVAAQHAVLESFGKPVIGSLPTIIRSFKSAVTKQINMNRSNKEPPFWQRGYYEHIIRTEKEFSKIGEYILGNPEEWAEDQENPVGKHWKTLPFEY